MTHLDILVAKIKAGQLTVLYGRDAPPALTNLPSGREVAGGLSGDQHSTSLVETASRLLQHEYTGYLRAKLTAGSPGPLHQALAALPISLWLTAAYDDRLEQALTAAGRPPNALVEDDDLALRDFGQPNLVYLSGRLGSLVPLIVTEEQHREAPDDDRLRLFEQTSEWLADQTLLLVGCDPSSGSDFERWIYGRLLGQLGAPAADAYLLWPNAAPADVTRWQGHGVTLIDSEPITFLSGLTNVAAPLPADRAIERLMGLLTLLRGAPTATQATALVQAIPEAVRLDWVRLTIRLKLVQAAGQPPQLQAALAMETEPDVTHCPADFRPTGISLQRLRNWAARAEQGRQSGVELPQGSPVEKRGIEFFEAIVAAGSPERDCYEEALLFDQTGFTHSLNIVIEPEDTRLSPIPWELLHDGRVGNGRVRGRGFLALKYPVYRRLAGTSSPAQVSGRLEKALVVAADYTQRLKNLDAEVDWLVETLTQAGVGQVDVRRPTHEDISRPEEIKALLRDGGYQLFHFTGHGLFDESDPAQSKLALGRAGERNKALTATALAEVAREGQLVLVFLSACDVGLTAEETAGRPWLEAGIVDALTRAGVPATVGMRWIIGEQNGRTLTERFYTELLKGRPVEQALLFARQDVENQADWANPILTKRHGVLSL
ncbi:MAG: CHAT domain-containing protein [Chloroflexota bacterium]